MITTRNREHRDWLRCCLLVSTLLVTLTGIALAEIIPGERRIKWDPGVRGGIPKRNAVFADVRNAPYNAKGDGVADDSIPIQHAINACTSGQVVYIPRGSYKINSPIFLKDGITLRGDGMGLTTIKGASNYGYDYLIGILDPKYDSGFAGSTVRSMTGGLSKGSTSITTSTAHGWSAGNFILIDQLENAYGDPIVKNDGTSGACTWCGRDSGNRPLGQWVKITAVPTDNTATIDPPLHWSYDYSKAPQGIKVNAVRQNAGVEDLTIDNSVSGPNGVRYVVAMYGAINCWLYRVEMIGSYRRMVNVNGGLWNTIAGCELHEGVPATPITGSQYGPDRGYGIFLGPWPTACLVEDNTFYHLSFGVSLEGAPSGNVIAYNYFTTFYYPDNDWQRIAIGHHGAHPMMNLIEGNYAEGLGIEADTYWGTSSHTTLSRNRITNTTRSCGTWAIDLYQGVRYFNIVGNVLGTNTDNTYELENDYIRYCGGAGSDRAIYKFGYTEGGDSSPAGNDAQVKATLLRHGNWDSVSNLVNWDEDISDHSLPSSYYLTSKPLFFGNCEWPPIGPDLNPMVKTLPAKARYEGSSVCGGVSNIPQPPRNLKIASP